MSNKQLQVLLATAGAARLSLLYWNDVLNFYREHRDELDDHQILALYRRSEECRAYWNTDRPSVTRVRRADGSLKQIISLRKGLACNREEVATDLYAVAEGILLRSSRDCPSSLLSHRHHNVSSHRFVTTRQTQSTSA